MKELNDAIIVACTWRSLPTLVIALYLGWCLAFLMHEFGHYFVALSFKVVPTSLHVGDWGPRASFDYAGTHFDIRLFCNPLGNAANFFEKGKCWWFAALLIILAGSTVNLGTGAIFLWLGVHFQSGIALMLALASISVGIGQFTPAQGTDGWMAVQIIRLVMK
jgi:hypothetical protein